MQPSKRNREYLEVFKALSQTTSAILRSIQKSDRDKQLCKHVGTSHPGSSYPLHRQPRPLDRDGRLRPPRLRLGQHQPVHA